jgi:hypothetical protein
MRATRALPVVLTALCATVSASTAAALTLADPPVGELRDCRTRGEGTAPQKLPVGGVRIGPLVLWPSIRIRPGGPPSGAAWPFVVKVPVVLPARSKVVLAIAPEAVGRAAFQHRGKYVTAVRFEACRETVRAFAYKGTVGKLTGFPFAIGLAQRSACIPLELWIDGRETPIRRVVPMGRRAC